MPPDTTNYMILGYVIFSVVMLVYLLSLLVRSRNLKQDIELLQELDQDAPKE